MAEQRHYRPPPGGNFGGKRPRITARAVKRKPPLSREEEDELDEQFEQLPQAVAEGLGILPDFAMKALQDSMLGRAVPRTEEEVDRLYTAYMFPGLTTSRKAPITEDECATSGHALPGSGNPSLESTCDGAAQQSTDGSGICAGSTYRGALSARGRPDCDESFHDKKDMVQCERK